MFFKILSLIDILAGFALLLSLKFLVPYTFLFWLGIIILVKGLYSFLTAVYSGMIVDIMGYLDIGIGIILLLMNFGVVIPLKILILLALLVLGKGTFSLIS